MEGSNVIDTQFCSVTSFLDIIHALFEFEDPDLIVRLIKKIRIHGLFYRNSKSVVIKIQKKLARLLLKSIKRKLFLVE
jgi:hypothetical protein